MLVLLRHAMPLSCWGRRGEEAKGKVLALTGPYGEHSAYDLVLSYSVTTEVYLGFSARRHVETGDMALIRLMGVGQA